MAQLASAPEWGSGGRWFESSRPDHNIKGIVMDNKEVPAPDDIKFERRQFKRISKTCIVSYAPVKSEEIKFDISQTKNLSEGGLLFISDKKFEKDVILKIKLRLPEFSDYVIVQVQVVDSTQIVKNLIYETRGRFVEAGQSTKEAIRRLADHA